MSWFRELTQPNRSPILPWKLLFLPLISAWFVFFFFLTTLLWGQAPKTKEENRMCGWRQRKKNRTLLTLGLTAVKTAMPKLHFHTSPADFVRQLTTVTAATTAVTHLYDWARLHTGDSSRESMCYETVQEIHTCILHTPQHKNTSARMI